MQDTNNTFQKITRSKPRRDEAPTNEKPRKEKQKRWNRTDKRGFLQ